MEEYNREIYLSALKDYLVQLETKKDVIENKIQETKNQIKELEKRIEDEQNQSAN